MTNLTKMDLNNFSILNTKDFDLFGRIDVNYTSGGVLYKYVEKDSNGNYAFLYKSGLLQNRKFSNKEVIIEQICNDILDYLNLEHAYYSICATTLKLTKAWVKQKILINKSEWFVHSDETFIHADKIIDVCDFRKSKAYYKLIEMLPHIKKDLDNMILFDYLVNNTDRHFKNFGFITNINTEDIKLAPLYDHGFALGIDYDSEYLGMVLDDEEDDYDFDLEVNLDNADTCKSFATSNRACVQLVDSSDIFKGTNLKDILAIIDNYSNYLPKENILFTKEILTDRYNKLIERFGS